MTQEQFENLSTGDAVRHVKSPYVHIVMANYGGRVTAVRTSDLTNPDEWVLVDKARYGPEPIIDPLREAANRLSDRYIPNPDADQSQVERGIPTAEEVYYTSGPGAD